jgi:hypothetical protein
MRSRDRFPLALDQRPWQPVLPAALMPNLAAMRHRDLQNLVSRQC